MGKRIIYEEGLQRRLPLSLDCHWNVTAIGQLEVRYSWPQLLGIVMVFDIRRFSGLFS